MIELLLILMSTTFGIPGSGQEADLPPIRNFLKINNEYCTGGQPSPQHLEKLKKDGVRVIINLRAKTEHRSDLEEAKAKELGLKYISIPVVYNDPKDEQADEFLKATDDPSNRPAFIHCAAAIRVGAFWMIRRVLRDGWALEKAEEEAARIGLHHAPHLTEFARSYIARHGK